MSDAFLSLRRLAVEQLQYRACVRIDDHLGVTPLLRTMVERNGGSADPATVEPTTNRKR